MAVEYCDKYLFFILSFEFEKKVNARFQEVKERQCVKMLERFLRHVKDMLRAPAASGDVSLRTNDADVTAKLQAVKIEAEDVDTTNGDAQGFFWGGGHNLAEGRLVSKKSGIWEIFSHYLI